MAPEVTDSRSAETRVPTHSSRDETFLSAKHQSYVYRAERTAELKGTFRVEERTKLRIAPLLQAASSSNARAFPLFSNLPETPLQDRIGVKPFLAADIKDPY